MGGVGRAAAVAISEIDPNHVSGSKSLSRAASESPWHSWVTWDQPDRSETLPSRKFGESIVDQICDKFLKD
jgi:hypothetical protein